MNNTIEVVISAPEELEATIVDQNRVDANLLQTTVVVNPGVDDVIVDGESAVINRVAYITLPDVPTKVSQLQNDTGFITEDALDGYATEDWVESQGYLTEHQSLANYPTKPEVTQQITNYHDATKQDKLTPGAHITINSDNVISTDLEAQVCGVLVDGRDVLDPQKVARINLTGKQDVIGDLTQIRYGAQKGATSVQPSELDNYASKQWVEDKHYLTEASLNNYATHSEVQTVVQNHHDSTKQNVIGDLNDIRAGATSGATAVQPSQISDMATRTWVEGKGYTTIQAVDQHIAAYHDPAKQNKLTPGAHITIVDDVISADGVSGNVDDVKVDGVSVVTDKVANIDLSGKQNVISDLDTIRTNATAGKAAYDTIDTYGDIVTHNTSEFATAAQGSKADSAIQPEAISDMATKTWVGEQNYATETYVNNHHDSTKIDVAEKGVASGVALLDASSHVIGVETVDNVTSAGSTKPLTANQGKLLADRIANLEARGRYLAIWNCATGYPTTEPTSSPYTYKSGDYFIVGAVATGSENNYRPNGSQFIIGTHSTTVETAEVAPNDYYLYDSTSWKLLKNTQKEVAFENIAGDPYDNTELAGALNAKSTVSVSNTGTSTSKVKYITVDGTEYKMADEPTEQTVKLESDLYTYVNIGKITGASQTNPVKVADAGDPLKDVFNAILGTEVDVNPTINQAGTTFTKSGQTGTTTESGGEIGRTINAQTGTVTFTVTNTATCTYGLKAGTYDTYSKTTATTFNYPIKTRTVEVGGTSYNYQIKIEYPTLNGCTLTVTAGTLVKNDINGRMLYCNVDTQNKVTISIAMPAGASTGSAQTRFNQLVADVDFNAAAYQGVTVDNFWTYLKAVYNSGKSHSAITNVKSTAYTINAGSYYTYYKVTNDTIMSSTGWTGVGSTSITDIVVVANAGQYIWFASTQNKSAIYEFNQVSSKYNTDPTATTKLSSQTIHTATGQDVSSYYTYRTTNGRSGATDKKFKLA